MNTIKQASSVRGSKIVCINYQMCPVCYGCRSYDARDPECKICKDLDTNIGRNYHICNKELHESWKINKLITKNKFILNSAEINDTISFKSYKK